MYVYFTVLSSSCRLMKDFCMYIVFALFFLIIHYLPSSYAQRIVGFLPRKAFLDGIYFNSRTFYNFSGYNTQEGDSRKCVSDPLSRLLFNSFKKETQPATTNQTKSQYHEQKKNITFWKAAFNRLSNDMTQHHTTRHHTTQHTTQHDTTP